MVSIGSGLVTGLLSMRISRRPIIAGLTGGVVGPLVGTMTVATSFPDALLHMLDEPNVDSMIVDEVVCPAVQEFQPCLRDERCKRLLSKGERSSTLLGCIDACTARTQ